MRFFFSTFLEWEVWSTYTMDWSAASSLCVDAQSIFIILSKELTVMKREKENHEKLEVLGPYRLDFVLRAFSHVILEYW